MANLIGRKILEISKEIKEELSLYYSLEELFINRISKYIDITEESSDILKEETIKILSNIDESTPDDTINIALSDLEDTLKKYDFCKNDIDMLDLIATILLFNVFENNEK